MRLRTLLALVALSCVPFAGVAQQKDTHKSGKSHLTGVSTTKVGKKTPLRDPKTGRFISKSETGKSAPARDPKTGRFISKTKLGKSTPARDPKTGRFIKKGSAPR